MTVQVSPFPVDARHATCGQLASRCGKAAADAVHGMRMSCRKQALALLRTAVATLKSRGVACGKPAVRAPRRRHEHWHACGCVGGRSLRGGTGLCRGGALARALRRQPRARRPVGGLAARAPPAPPTRRFPRSRGPPRSGARGIRGSVLRQFLGVSFERGESIETLLANNYGDLPLHWTYVAYLARGAPFWPENPIAAGERLRYPFGVDLVTPSSSSSASESTGSSGSWASWPPPPSPRTRSSRWGRGFAVAAFLFSGGWAGLSSHGERRAPRRPRPLAWKNLFLTLFVPATWLPVLFPPASSCSGAGDGAFSGGSRPSRVGGGIAVGGAAPLPPAHVPVRVRSSWPCGPSWAGDSARPGPVSPGRSFPPPGPRGRSRTAFARRRSSGGSRDGSWPARIP